LDNRLFDPSFLRKLEYLKLVAGRLHRGERRGEHETYRKGTSLEFADYRSYQGGDDFRYIDWNIYNRLDRLMVKLFAAEEDLTLHILLDDSRSMAFGQPSKIDCACRMSAALGYIGLANLDRVGVTTFAEEPGDSLPPHRSRKHIFSLFNYLSNIECEGATNINRALVNFSLRSKRPGLAVVLSDLLDENGFEEGLKALLYRNYDVVLIQILDEEEIEPGIKGAFRLIDSETGSRRKVTVDSTTLKLYRDKLGRFFQGIEKFCLSRGIEYMRTSNQVPIEDLVLKYLRQGMHLH
jgi:uncharacterized protein (DUF58 family)